MKRRTVLAGSGTALASSLAGCIETGADGDDESGGNDGNADVTIVDVDTESAPDLPVEPSVSVVNEEATETTPAGIAVSWENVDDGSVRVGEANSIVFSATRSEDESAHLLAFDQIGDRSGKVTFEDCWYVSGDLVFDGDHEFIDLEPGTRHTAKPDLYASDEACLISDSYQFETLISVEDRFGHEEKTEEWGFTLNIDIR